MAPLPPKPGRLGPDGKEIGSDRRDGSELERSKDVRATEELSDRCERLEEELEELKAKYEMFFLGVERLEPSRQRDELKRKIARLKTAFTRNTGLRFRVQALYARYIAYERLWLRSAREKEEGTYHRDLFKARRRAEAERAKRASAPKAGHVEDVDLSDLSGDAATPPPAAAPPPARRGAPSTPAPRVTLRGPSEAQIRELYSTYVAAKKRCNEDVSRLTYDTVAKSVVKQVPEILERYKATSVEFKVVIRDGKAILKAVPKT